MELEFYNATLVDSQSVYNPKMDYIRIYCGYSIAEYSERYTSKNILFEFLDKFKKMTRNGTKIVFDASAEAENLAIVFNEVGNPDFLDWLLEYSKINNFSKNQIELWTSDFDCRKNINEKYKNLIVGINQMRNFVPYADDFKFIETRKFDKKFICAMSRITRERTSMYEFIINNKIEESFYYSYNAKILTPNKDDSDVIKVPMERYLGIDFDDSMRAEFATYRFQKKSVINIVMETFFYSYDELGRENPSRFFTEKTFRPIAMLQPFILVSNYGMLNRLKSFGFKTFDKWWDESYDLIENDNDRLNKIFELISELNKLSIEELNNIYLEMIPILKYNYNHLLNDVGNEFYEFHTEYTFNKLARLEMGALFYIENI